MGREGFRGNLSRTRRESGKQGQISGSVISFARIQVEGKK